MNLLQLRTVHALPSWDKAHGSGRAAAAVYPSEEGLVVTPIGQADNTPTPRSTFSPRDLRMVFQADPTVLSAARRELQGCLLGWGLKTQDAEDVVLAAQEVLANAVLHGCSGVRACESTVTLTATCSPTAVWIGVQDPSRDLPVLRCAGEQCQNGRGLLLVAALASRWGTTADPSGKTVWFELDTPDRKAAQ